MLKGSKEHTYWHCYVSERNNFYNKKK